MKNKSAMIPLTMAMLFMLLGTSSGALVSTPYVNTFDTAASTNDFVLGGSPASKIQYIEWTWASYGVHQNYMRSANASATLYGWATLDFSDLGGTPSEALNFTIDADTRAKSNVTTKTNSPGGYQGICALASDAAVTNYYYGRVYFTNVVGYLVIEKMMGGGNTVVLSSPRVETTITFDLNQYYGLHLVGEYGTQASPDLTLTLSLTQGAETNTVSLVDPDPLDGTLFGYRACNTTGGTWFWWDNLVVESSTVKELATVIIVK